MISIVDIVETILFEGIVKRARISIEKRRFEGNMTCLSELGQDVFQDIPPSGYI